MRVARQVGCGRRWLFDEFLSVLDESVSEQELKAHFPVAVAVTRYLAEMGQRVCTTAEDTEPEYVTAAKRE